MATKVQITVELLEKLAGIRPKPSAKQQQQQQQLQQRQKQQKQQLQHLQPGRLGLGLPIPPPHFHPEVPKHQQHEQELQAVIRESKRVGELLLKAGDQELAAVQQQAEHLLDKFRSQIKPMPCEAERQSVLQCYKEHGQDVLTCSSLIDAYRSCARQSAAASAAVS